MPVTRTVEGPGSTDVMMNRPSWTSHHPPPGITDAIVNETWSV
ncbi:hypothetical protein HMPREF1494_2193 [Bifidobacterium sp. MSTE12]|nr:hypothetical protein HMPREF1494_2193 [Bifidobacterium sp. MSTE12]